MNLLQHKDLIDGNPIHIATVNKENKPNLAVASDVKVIGENQFVISVNEMINTQENIKSNPNVVITVFDKDFKGLRIFGIAQYFTNGKYYDICKETFFGKGEVSTFGATKPKGTILVTVTNIAEYI